MRVFIFLDDQILLSFQCSLIKELFRNENIVGNYFHEAVAFLDLFYSIFFASVIPLKQYGIQLSQKGCLPYIHTKKDHSSLI